MKKFSIKTRNKLIEEIQSYPNLVAMFFAQAKKRKNKPFLWAIKDGKYKSMSWGEAANKVRALAEGLKQLGLKKNDRVVILSENRPEWLIADFAIMLAGGISVPVYTTNTPENHQHVLKDSDAHLAISSSKPLTKKLMTAAINSFWETTIVCMDPPDIQQSGVVTIESWDEVMEKGKKILKEGIVTDTSPTQEDIACLIYTSGTGGAPKGVMLTHSNLIANVAAAIEAMRDIGIRRDKDSFFSIIPLSHAYEHTAGQFLAIFMCSQIYYLSAMDKLLSNIGEAKPSIVVAVPRLFEVIQTRIYQNIRRKGGKAEALFNRTVELGKKRASGRPLSIKEKLEDSVLSLLVRRKIQKVFGGRVKALVTGGAPLNGDVAEFLSAFNIPLLQGYGQTEASPLISCNTPSNCDFTTVGAPLLNLEIQIALDGEILVRGKTVMKGYWNNPEATEAAIDEGGWLHTGDIGEFDARGRIKITDRKKDIIVNSGGDNISPLRVEGILSLEPEISQCMIYGDKQPHMVGIIVPSADFITEFAERNGVNPNLAELRFNDTFLAELTKIVEKANQRLSVIEKVRKIMVPAEAFSVENNMMTPTLKIRRNQIKAVYGDDLLALYNKKGA